jgi:hypothetical protein
MKGDNDPQDEAGETKYNAAWGLVLREYGKQITAQRQECAQQHVHDEHDGNVLPTIPR